MTYAPYPDQPAQPGGPGPSDGSKPRLRGRTPLRLSIVFFVVAVALIVVGIVVLAKKSIGQVDDFKRVRIASGSGSVQLNGTGKFLIYYEASNVNNDIDRIPDFRIAVEDPAGKSVALTPYGDRSDGKVDKLTYSDGGHHGAAAFQFNASTTGTYQVRLQAEQTLPTDAGVAFGRDIAKGAVVAVLLIVGGVLFLLAAIALLIVGLAKRNRHRGQLAGGYGGLPANYPPRGYGQLGGYGQGGPQPGYGQQPQPGYGQQPGYGPDGPQRGWGPPPPSTGPSLAKE